jgi:hypothetical protein
MNYDFRSLKAYLIDIGLPAGLSDWRLPGVQTGQPGRFKSFGFILLIFEFRRANKENSLSRSKHIHSPTCQSYTTGRLLRGASNSL